MNIENKLIAEVQEFLKRECNIVVPIPSLKNLVDVKINLKIYQDGSGSEVNRYRSIVETAEMLLESSSLGMSDINSFMGQFNKIINTDIEIMQQNDMIRENSFRIREKLTHRTEQINRKKSKIIENSLKIHDKNEVLSFVSIDLKNYLASIKLVTEDYEAVKNVEVHTPVKIDQIYSYQQSSEEDYQDHYEPLLEVLVRLRSNINNLYHDAENCSKVDLPIKSVNLLANCQSLLSQLQVYLMTDNCAFNRLIFYVVTLQNENMRLISNFYQTKLKFMQDMVYNIYKSIYLGHLFSNHYHKIHEEVEKERRQIIDLITKCNIECEKDKMKENYQKLISHKKNLLAIKSEKREIKKIVCFKKTTFMVEYLEEKIFKKLNLLLQLEGEIDDLQLELEKCGEYIRNVEETIKEYDQMRIIELQVERDIEILEADVNVEKTNGGSGQGRSGESSEEIFKRNFSCIQKKMVDLSYLEANLARFSQETKQKRLKEQYFSKQITRVQSMRQRYLDVETHLLNSYQHILSQKQDKQNEAISISEATCQKCKSYLTNEKVEPNTVWRTMGSEILNEDEQCETVKALLVEVDKSEYLLKRYVRENKNSKTDQYMQELEHYRKFLEWLLVVFEGSMDQKILESIMDRMEFKEKNVENVQKNIDKVNELLSQFDKYIKHLKKIAYLIQFKQNRQSEQPGGVQSRIYNKIFKICKDRLTLYELLEVIYRECLTVYSELKLKEKQSFDFEKKGIQLFDKETQAYSLLYYQAKNNINILKRQIEDVNIPPKINHYINDDIYEPFANRLNTYLPYTEKDLLSLTLGLEGAAWVNDNHKPIIFKFQATILLANKSMDLKKYREELEEQCLQVIKIESHCYAINELSSQKFVFHNIGEIKKITDEYAEHFELARGIMATQYLDTVCSGCQFEKTKVKQCRSHLQKVFQK